MSPPQLRLHALSCQRWSTGSRVGTRSSFAHHKALVPLLLFWFSFASQRFLQKRTKQAPKSPQLTPGPPSFPSSYPSQNPRSTGWELAPATKHPRGRWQVASTSSDAKLPLSYLPGLVYLGKHETEVEAEPVPSRLLSGGAGSPGCWLPSPLTTFHIQAAFCGVFP